MHTFSDNSTGVPAFLAKLWRLVEDEETNNLIYWNTVSNKKIDVNVIERKRFCFFFLIFFSEEQLRFCFIATLFMSRFLPTSKMD